MYRRFVQKGRPVSHSRHSFIAFGSELKALASFFCGGYCSFEKYCKLIIGRFQATENDYLVRLLPKFRLGSIKPQHFRTIKSLSKQSKSRLKQFPPEKTTKSLTFPVLTTYFLHFSYMMFPPKNNFTSSPLEQTRIPIASMPSNHLPHIPIKQNPQPPKSLPFRALWNLFHPFLLARMGVYVALLRGNQHIQNTVQVNQQKIRMSSHQLQEQQVAEVAGFIAKTFQILKNDEYNKITYWSPSGCEFIIKDINKFQQLVLPKYFRHNKINSFIRQLNMYGFHKSRADHTKSVFSHPLFLKDREDLLINIKRKIKGKLDQENLENHQTPQKPRMELEMQTTGSKEIAETGNQLFSVRNMQNGEMLNNTSFNFIGTKEKFCSLMNLNFTVNNLPQLDVERLSFAEESQDQDDQCVSIEHKITNELIEVQDQPKEYTISYKFMNPSCFFQSMRKQCDI